MMVPVNNYSSSSALLPNKSELSWDIFPFTLAVELSNYRSNASRENRDVIDKKRSI